MGCVHSRTSPRADNRDRKCRRFSWADKQAALQRHEWTNDAIGICQKSAQYQNFVSVTLHPASQTLLNPALLLIFQVLPVTFPDCCHTQAILLQDSAPDMSNKSKSRATLRKALLSEIFQVVTFSVNYLWLLFDFTVWATAHSDDAMLKIIPEQLQVATNIHHANCLKSEEWEKLDGAFQNHQCRVQIGRSLFEPRQPTDDDFIYTTYILICQGFAHLEMEFGDEVQARKTSDLMLGCAQCICVHPETWTFSAEIGGQLHINLWEFLRFFQESGRGPRRG